MINTQNLSKCPDQENTAVRRKSLLFGDIYNTDPMYQASSDEINAVLRDALAQPGSFLRLSGGDHPSQQAFVYALCKAFFQRSRSCVYIEVGGAAHSTSNSTSAPNCSNPNFAKPKLNRTQGGLESIELPELETCLGEIPVLAFPFSELHPNYFERQHVSTATEVDAAIRALGRRACPPSLVIVSSLATALINEFRTNRVNASSDSPSRHEVFLAGRRASTLLREVAPVCEKERMTVLWAQPKTVDLTAVVEPSDSKVGAVAFEVGKALATSCDFGVQFARGHKPFINGDRISFFVWGSENASTNGSNSIGIAEADHTDEDVDSIKTTVKSRGKERKERYNGVRIQGEDRQPQKLTIYLSGGFHYKLWS
ncbi:hypothetical protein EON80_23925 [bacterium]|nr:MAG: hypothetical protein EON80_23925 [bacterium]